MLNKEQKNIFIKKLHPEVSENNRNSFIKEHINPILLIEMTEDAMKAVCQHIAKTHFDHLYIGDKKLHI